MTRKECNDFAQKRTALADSEGRENLGCTTLQGYLVASVRKIVFGANWDVKIVIPYQK